MRAYGDESGHLRGLLNGDCEVYVVGIVAGTQLDCFRCPKATVRRVTNIPEAKWNDLTDVQKRRLFECFASTDGLQFGYAVFTKEQLHTLQNYHLLYQNVSFPPAWDLALTGYAYGEILFDMGLVDHYHRPVFTFDRISSRPQCEAVRTHIHQFVPTLRVQFNGSRQVHGIQAADCLAGAVAEDQKHGTDWLDYLSDHTVIETYATALVQLENDLVNV